MEKIDYDKIIHENPWILERGKKFVISPDADGFYCAIILTNFLDWKLVGFYDTDVLAIKRNYKDEDIVYIDVEIFNAAVKSMGNHCVLPKGYQKLGIEDKFSNCINPNLIRGISFKDFSHKYPYGTSHFLLSIIAFANRKKLINLSRFLNTTEKAVTFMFADGMIDNIGSYPENWSDWFRYLRFDEKWNPFHLAIKMNLLEQADTRTKFYEKRDSFTKSKQRGDKLSLLNQKKGLEALEPDKDGFHIKELNRGNVTGFITMVCNTLNLKYKDELFDCWDSLDVIKYEKCTTGVSIRDFKNILPNEPISFAYIKSKALCYTKSAVCNDTNVQIQ